MLLGLCALALSAEGDMLLFSSGGQGRPVRRIPGGISCVASPVRRFRGHGAMLKSQKESSTCPMAPANLPLSWRRRYCMVPPRGYGYRPPTQVVPRDAASYPHPSIHDARKATCWHGAFVPRQVRCFAYLKGPGSPSARPVVASPRARSPSTPGESPPPDRCHRPGSPLPHW
jgi:hypothetical protein